MVDAMLGCQLRRRQLATQRLKRNLRLEIRRIELPLARHPHPSFSVSHRAYPLVEMPGTISKTGSATRASRGLERLSVVPQRGAGRTALRGLGATAEGS